MGVWVFFFVWEKVRKFINSMRLCRNPFINQVEQVICIYFIETSCHVCTSQPMRTISLYRFECLIGAQLTFNRHDGNLLRNGCYSSALADRHIVQHHSSSARKLSSLPHRFLSRHGSVPTDAPTLHHRRTPRRLVSRKIVPFHKQPPEFHLKSRMRHGVHIRIDARGRFAEHSRNHRAQRRNVRLVTGYAEQRDHRVRCPRGEPQSDDGQNDDGQFDFGALRLVAIRLNFLGSGHFAHDVIVAKGDYREGHRPGEQEEDEHEDACRRAAIEIVEAAAGQKAFGHILAESDVERRHHGEECAVHPDEQHHQPRTDSRDRAQWVERIDDHKVAVDGDGGQGGDRRDTGESTEEAIETTS